MTFQVICSLHLLLYRLLGFSVALLQLRIVLAGSCDLGFDLCQLGIFAQVLLFVLHLQGSQLTL